MPTWCYVRSVTMYEAVCPLCGDVVSAAPGTTEQEAASNLAAHLHIVHDRPNE